MAPGPWDQPPSHLYLVTHTCPTLLPVRLTLGTPSSGKLSGYMLPSPEEGGQPQSRLPSHPWGPVLGEGALSSIHWSPDAIVRGGLGAQSAGSCGPGVVGAPSGSEEGASSPGTQQSPCQEVAGPGHTQQPSRFLAWAPGTAAEALGGLLCRSLWGPLFLRWVGACPGKARTGQWTQSPPQHHVGFPGLATGTQTPHSLGPGGCALAAEVPQP